VHGSLPVGGSIHRGIVNGHEMRIARKLQIRFNERRSQRNSFLERRQRISGAFPDAPRCAMTSIRLFSTSQNASA